MIRTGLTIMMLQKKIWKNIVQNGQMIPDDPTESTGLEHLNDSKAFIEYLNDMDHIYKNIDEYNPNKKCKILIGFDDMIANMLSNTSVTAEVFIRVLKTNISIIIIIQSYSAVPKYFRLNSSKQIKTSTNCILSFIR